MKYHHKVIIGIAATALATTAYVVTHQPVPRIGPSDIYPPVWATGAVNASIQSAEDIQATICNPAWSTKSIRPPSSYTTLLKISQLNGGTSVNGDTNPADYEEDHLISLELGGSSTSTANLWPEPYTASVADGGAHSKDQVENYLHAQVCAGHMTLQEAQHEIVSDWYAVYKKMAPTFGGVQSITDPGDETDQQPTAGGSVSIPVTVTVQ